MENVVRKGFVEIKEDFDGCSDESLENSGFVHKDFAVMVENYTAAHKDLAEMTEHFVTCKD